MSTRWIAAGRYKLGPESRIACANLLLAVLLACATLVLGPVGGRCALGLATWGFLHAKSALRSNALLPPRTTERDTPKPISGSHGRALALIPRSQPIVA